MVLLACLTTHADAAVAVEAEIGAGEGEIGAEEEETGVGAEDVEIEEAAGGISLSIPGVVELPVLAVRPGAVAELAEFTCEFSTARPSSIY